jgi:phosphotriesterase-related protein
VTDTVETVRGAVDVAALGTTYMHEHIFVLTTDVQLNYPDEWGEEDARIDDAVQKLDALAAQGVDTIVDPTVIGLGRYIPRIQRVAERTAMNIVVATGCYTYDEVPNYFATRDPNILAALGHEAVDPMVELFVRDITDGIAGTGVRAAFLKCAIDHKGMTDGVRRIMLAVAEAHRQTGAPVTVHTHPGTETGTAVQQVLCDEGGVDPSRIVLGHSGDSTDVEHLTALAKQGFILGMDRFGLNAGTSLEERCATVVELCRRGFAGQMVLSQDAACYIDWIDPRLLALMPEWNYLHIHDAVLPQLRASGVSDEQIQTMLVDVPRRYFAG